MMTLGVPGDLVTALLIGAMLIHGLHPGPLLFKEHPHIVSSIFISLTLSNFFFLALGLCGANLFARLITLRRQVLVAMILCLSLVGTYSIENSIFHVWVYLAGGIAGYVMTRVGVPVSPLVLGFILGTMVESFFRQALILSFGNPIYFFTRPIAALFLGLTILLILSPYLMKKLFGYQYRGG